MCLLSGVIGRRICFSPAMLDVVVVLVVTLEAVPVLCRNRHNVDIHYVDQQIDHADEVLHLRYHFTYRHVGRGAESDDPTVGRPE